VPDHCRMDVDIRYLPNQAPDEVLRQVRSLGAEVTPIYEMPPATLDPGEPHVQVLREAVGALEGGTAPAVGRHGASDAVFFLERGIPAIEFGPAGGGHHGPEEYVDIESLRRYRRILVEFARRLSSTPNRG
jgi:succinyl-diaminopimelate desuccinylase